MQRTIFQPLLLITLVAALLLSNHPLHAAKLSNKAEIAPIPPSTVASQNASIKAEMNQPFTLAIAESATITDGDNEVKIELADLIEDSRCPSDVTCVQAGQAIFSVNLSINGEPMAEEVPIGNNRGRTPSELGFEGYTLKLESVQPAAAASNRRLRKRDYRVTFTLTTDSENDQQFDQGFDQEFGLGMSFELRVGETITLSDVDFSITLRSLSDDSGCFTADDCSTMTADGSLALVAGDQKQLLTFSAGFAWDSPFASEFAGYDVLLTGVEKTLDGELVTHFTIQKHVIEPPFAIAEPIEIDRCEYFSRFDAQAVLQADVVPQAYLNIILAPLHPDTPKLAGLCGYVSTNYTAKPEVEPSQPHLLSEIFADHLVVAGLLDAQNLNELYPLIESIRLTDAQEDESYLRIFQTQWVAGDNAGVMATITAQAEQSDAFVVVPLEGIGEEAIWLTQKIDRGRSATILARTGDSFALVRSLTDFTVDEETVRAQMTIIARRILPPPMTTQSTTQPTPFPETPPATPEVNIPSGQGCDLFSAAEAAGILGEEVYSTPVNQDEGCGYVPKSELSPKDPDFSLDDTKTGVIMATLNPADSAEMVQSLIMRFAEGNSDIDRVTEARLLAAVDAGDLQTAIHVIAISAKETPDTDVVLLHEVNDGTMMIVEKDGERTILAAYSADDTGLLTVLFASRTGEPMFWQVRSTIIDILQRASAQQ